MNITQESIVCITGASSGIGAALAVELARFGASIALCARRRDQLEEVAVRVAEAGGKPLVLPTDVTSKPEAEAMMRTIINTFGRIDILINNAGRGNMASVEDTSQEQIEHMFAVNVYALWYTTAIALPVMKAQGYGHIINVSSIAGKMAFPFNSAYTAAKHACIGFTAALRAELVRTGVQATVVCPAGVETEWATVTEGGPIGELFVQGIRASRVIAKEQEIPLAPLSKMKKPEEIARRIVEVILKNEGNDVYTHEGTYEQAIQAVENREALEQSMLPLYLGMKEVYEKRKKTGEL